MSSSNTQCSETAGPTEANDHQQKPFMGYHSTKFWKELKVGVVALADPKTVLAATKDLCRHFVAQESPALFMEKAAKLAAQFRNLEDGCLTELLVDQAGLKKLFTLDPNVSFDLAVSSRSCDFVVEKGSSDKSSKKRSFLSCCKALFLPEVKKLKQPLTIIEDNSPSPRLRLSFSKVFCYQAKDQFWLEAFLSSVDQLTKTQALVFGPAFACLFVILGIVAGDPSAISEVAEEMVKLCDSSLERVPTSVARTGCYPRVKMPPLTELKKLLSTYTGVKLAQVYFNTVAGGLMYARHARRWSLRTKKDSMTFVLMSIIRYHDDQTPLMTSLVSIEALAQRHGCPQMATKYFAFIKQNFPESWKAFRHISENFDTSKVGKIRYDPFWKFAMAFSDRVFGELSYERNHRVCNITAVVEDLLETRPGEEYIYEELVRQKLSSLRISGADLNLAVEICEVLRKELGVPEEETPRSVGFAQDS